MILFLISFIVIAMVMFGMAIGLMFGRGSLKGSCGGLNGGNCFCVTPCEKKRDQQKVQKVFFNKEGASH